MIRWTFLLLTLSLLFNCPAQGGDRIPWTLQQEYTGPHSDSFQKLRWEIPQIIRQAIMNIAIETGLDFQDGWEAPLFIQFVNGAPEQIENALAYVQFQSDEEKYWQSLNINLSAYEQEGFNFQKVFSHELVHAMLNDAVGPSGVSQIPVWFQEGLAVFGAGQGESMLTSYVVANKGMRDDYLINGLDGPHGALDYAEDYLAFEYIRQTQGITGFKNFIREVVFKKGDIVKSYEYTCNQSWDNFLVEYKKYAVDRIRSIKREPRFRGPVDKPY